MTLTPNQFGLPGVQWTPSEAASINEFLNTPVARKWLAMLGLMKPPINLGSTDQAALSGAFAAGYEYLLQNRIPLTRSVRKEEPDVNLKSFDPTKD